MAFEFVLLDARCLAGFHRVDGFEHGLDTHGKHAVEIEGAERIGPADRRLLPQEDVASIEAVVGPEDRKTGLLGSMRQQAVTRLIQSSADTYQETWSAFNCDYRSRLGPTCGARTSNVNLARPGNDVGGWAPIRRDRPALAERP